MAKGIYISPTEFVSFAEPRKSMTEEIATRQRSLSFYNLSLYLPNPDPILKKNGQDISVYRDLLADDRVWGSSTSRKAGVLSLEWEIDRGRKGSSKRRQTTILKELFQRLDVHRIMQQILDAEQYGFQPMEVLWEKRGGLLLPRDVVAKPPEWFVFGSLANDLRFRSKDRWIEGEESAPHTYLCPTHYGSYRNPYGEALLARCFWPTTFKKGGWRFWVQFAEKYGQAFAVGKIRRGATPAEMDDLADKLEAMVQDAIAVIYDDSSVEIMSDQGKGASSELFRSIINEANSAISTVQLGHAGAGESTPGKLGGETGAMEVRKDLVDSGKKLVCATMNQLIGWINELNWQVPDMPVFGLWEEEEVDLPQAERDDKLSGALTTSGLKLTRDYYLRQYNLEDGDIEVATPPPNLPPPGGGANLPPQRGGIEGGAQFAEQHRCPHCSSFAEGDPDAADAADAIVDQARDQAASSNLIIFIRTVIAGADSLETAAAQLKTLRWDPLSIKAAVDMLTTACVIARLTGRAEVLDEVAGAADFAEPLPFDNAIAFFRQKLNITTESWTDLWQGEHSRQFTVAGAMSDDMVNDFRVAIDRAISEGTTHATFLKEFDRIVETYGWDYNGTRGWRSKVIYETNIRTAYQAGRWQQLTDPDLLAVNPYLEYRLGDSANHRQLHVSWSGTVLPAGDHWWNTHYTPNGWGCKCKVLSVGPRDLKKLGKSGPDKAPNDGTYEWTDKKTGEVHNVPRGIDPGWAYNPGKEWLNPATGKLEERS